MLNTVKIYQLQCFYYGISCNFILHYPDLSSLFITEEAMDKKFQEFELNEFGWWITILVDKPMYVYYFGVFKSYWEAEYLKKEYAEDLEEEGAEIVGIQIKLCRPKKLTIPATLNFNT